MADSLIDTFRAGIERYGWPRVMFRLVPHIVWLNCRYALGFETVSDKKFYEVEEREGFDARFGTETSKIVDLEKETEESVRYRATPQSVVERALATVAERSKSRTFIDMGCGKGRVLLLASQRFDRVVGLDHSPELMEIARANVEIFRRSNPTCGAIELACLDFRNYEFPGEDLVLFCYESAWDVVLRVVLSRLSLMLEREKKQCTILWVTHLPSVPKLFDQFGFRGERMLSELKGDWFIHVLEHRRPT